ncbi:MULTISPECIES: MoaF-related domain-containing protein [unclassified Microbacterium]|uniref:MoaF-related domain-containing protein n=1 Tax=unclassified Microbacterium TaxID=2609290 RepID=UPI003016E8E9
MIGRKYLVRFPTMSFVLDFISETKLEFIVESSPDLPPGSAHTVDISIRPLRDELYLVSWQEASGNTVVHIEDFKNHQVHAFLTMNDLSFITRTAPLIELDRTNGPRDGGP